jgi:hypothetical protein
MTAASTATPDRKTMTFRSDLALRLPHATDFTATARALGYLDMKRSTPLKRSAPLARGTSTLRRSRIKRKRPRGQPPERKDEAFKAFVRLLPCCAPITTIVRDGDVLRFHDGRCGHRPCDPHHKHGDGKGIKTHDRTCIPLCRYHHRDAEDRRGAFCDFTKQQMRDWHDKESERVQALYERRMGNANA